MKSYNSVISESLGVPSEYNVVRVDEQTISSNETLKALFQSLSEASQNATPPDQSSGLWSFLLQAHVPGVLENLTTTSCINEYAVDFLTSRADVILVHEFDTKYNLSFTPTKTFDTGFANTEYWSWICSTSNTQPPPCRARLDDVKAMANEWKPYGGRVSSTV